MESFKLDKTLKTPSILIDKAKGLIELEGRSIPEDALRFYTPIYEWIDSHSNNFNTPTTINMKLDYFDTSSSKCILNLFRKLETLSEKGKSFSINWYYEMDDVEMKELGESYKKQTTLPIHLVEVEELY